MAEFHCIFVNLLAFSVSTLFYLVKCLFSSSIKTKMVLEGTSWQLLLKLVLKTRTEISTGQNLETLPRVWVCSISLHAFVCFAYII